MVYNFLPINNISSLVRAQNAASVGYTKETEKMFLPGHIDIRCNQDARPRAKECSNREYNRVELSWQDAAGLRFKTSISKVQDAAFSNVLLGSMVQDAVF